MKRGNFLISLFLLFFPCLLNTDEINATASKVEVNKEYVQELLVAKAYEYLGTPYLYAGISLKGVDCSGLVYTVYLEAAGKKLPRMVSSLYSGLAEAKGTLVPGDLLFFNTTGSVSHVGLYIGGKRMIHAASAGPNTGVIVSSLDEKYYKERYLGARRVFEYTTPALFVTLGATKITTTLSAPLFEDKPFNLSIAHRLAGGKTIVCSARTADAGKKPKEAVVEPGKDLLLVWSFAEAGDWVLSFRDELLGEIVRIEVKVERGFGG
jgi:probable lipoprotein NlpC